MANNTKVVPNVTSDFSVQGKADGHRIDEAVKLGEHTMAAVIFSRAQEMSENPQASADWLQGLQDGLIEAGWTKGTAQTRKSEAARVFNAFHLNPDETERAFHNEPYHKMILTCRGIVDSANNKVPKARNIGPKKISTKEKAKIVSRLVGAGASGSDALELMHAAQHAYIQAAGVPVGLVRQVDLLANELKKSGDQFWATLGEKLSKICTVGIEHQNRLDAKAAKEKAPEVLKAADRMKDVINVANTAAEDAEQQAALA